MDLAQFKADADEVLQGIINGIKAVQATPIAQEIEKQWPAAASVAAEVTGALPYVALGEIGLDALLTYGPALYALSKAIQIEPGKVDDPHFQSLGDGTG